MAEDKNTVNIYSREEATNANTMAQAARSLTEELKDQLGIRSRLNETQRETLNLARQLQRSAQENTVEIGNSGNIERQMAKDQKTYLAIKREVVDLTQGSNKVSKIELHHANRIAEATAEIASIQEQLATASAERRRELEGELAVQENHLSALGEIASRNSQTLALLKSSLDLSEQLRISREKEAEVQKDINNNMGVTGALVKGTGALMERLGMRSGIFQDAMKDSAAAMREMAEENVRNNAGFSKTEIMLTGFSKLSKGFGKALLDPFSILTKILVVLTSIDKAQTEYTRQTGRQASQLKGSSKIYQKQVSQVSTLVDLMKTAGELSRQTGLDVSSIFSPEQIGQISDAQKLLGLSAEQARGLGMQMKLANQSADEIGNAIYDNIDAGVNKKAVYDDILSTSDDIVASAGGNTKALAKAASAAKKLGMDLRKVSAIADGLLNFEDSISAELEAQLLTGKQINLNKAREAALNNDLEGVANELRKNGASAAEFSKMNRIQQEGLAKALGMSREELAKTVLTEKARAGMTEKQIADARGVTLEQSKQMDIQQKLQDSLFKLSEAFVPILDMLHPIVDLLGKGLNLISPFTPALLGAYGVIRLMRLGIVEKVKGMMSFSKQIIAAAKNFDILNLKQKLFGKMYKGGQFMPGGERAKAGGQRVGGMFGSKTTQPIPDKTSPATGKGTKGLTDSISKIDTKKLLQGALAMAAVAGAIFIFAKSVQELEKVEDWGNVATGLGAFAATIGVLGLVGKFASPGIIALGKALFSFGIAAAPAIPILLTIGATAALIGAGFALVGAGAMMFGKGIDFAANGVVKILSGITGLISSIPQLYLLGGALMSIAAGLGMIAVSGLAAIPALAALSGFALIATPLMAVSGIFGGGSDEKDTGFAELGKKVDTLIAVISNGGDVYLDSDKIGRTQAKSFSRITGS